MHWNLLRDPRHQVVKNKLVAVRMKNGDYWIVRWDGRTFTDQWGGVLSWMDNKDIDAYQTLEIR
jgi:hypothetical protein